jgi:alpha-tubulin suppressor-like RCC1 family protein
VTRARRRLAFGVAVPLVVASLFACNSILGVDDVKLKPNRDGAQPIDEPDALLDPIPIPDSAGPPDPKRPQVALGDLHTCARRVDGAVKCWGDDTQGQTGTGQTAPNGFVDVPTSVAGIDDATDIAAGKNHTCITRQTGKVACWGYNFDGQLGNGESGNRKATPIEAVGLTSAVAIAAGGNFSCAVRAAGSVACWGGNGQGQLGTGNETPSNTAVPVVDLQGIVAIAAGQAHACAVTRTGAVMCWGDGRNGQLGAGTPASSSKPVAVDQLPEAVSVAASERSTCALTQSHAVYCWGANELGQLGNGAPNVNPNPRPIIVSNLTDAIAIGGGRAHVCAARKGGNVVCWGAADRGQLGDGQARDAGSVQASFVTVQDFATAAAVSAGGAHSCGVTLGDTLLCWGAGDRGQLGIGSSDGGPVDSHAPVNLKGFP